MKFHVAWANVLSQNVTLRIAIVALVASTCILALSTMSLSLKKPLIIERACFSKTIQTEDSTQHPESEVESFLTVALSKRFDSTASDVALYLSSDEQGFRAKEQDELSQKGMAQRVLVNSVKRENGKFIVEADRIVSIGKIKTVVNFPLRLTLSSTDRTEGNPYGLILEKAEPVADDHNPQ